MSNFEEALEKYEDVIIHEDSTMENVAYEFIDGFYSLKDLPPILVNAIDYRQIARKLETDGILKRMGTSMRIWVNITL